MDLSHLVEQIVVPDFDFTLCHELPRFGRIKKIFLFVSPAYIRGVRVSAPDSRVLAKFVQPMLPFVLHGQHVRTEIPLAAPIEMYPTASHLLTVFFEVSAPRRFDLEVILDMPR